MNESDSAALREYIGEITHRRGVDGKMLPTLLQLLETPRARLRYPTLSAEEVIAIAGEFVRQKRTISRRSRR
jgi:hypothetical protein